MKDLFGVELKVGQLVGFTTRGRHNYTIRGEIVGFTQKMVKVQFLNRAGMYSDGEISNLAPSNLVVSITNKDETNE